MSRESRRKEALYPRQFNFHRKKELPWQLFFAKFLVTRNMIPNPSLSSLNSAMLPNALSFCLLRSNDYIKGFQRKICYFCNCHR